MQKLTDGNINIITHKGTRVITLDELINEYNIDTDLWEALDFKPNIWETPISNKTTWEITLVQNHQTKAHFVRKTPIEFEEFTSVANRVVNSKEYPVREYPSNQDKLMGVIKLADLHIDKLDLKSTPIKKKIKMYNNAIEEVLEDYDKFGMDKIAIVNLGDYYNTDVNNATTKGTQQQWNASEMDAWHLWIEFMMDNILKAQQVAPVEFITTPWNHDEYKSAYLHTVILKAIGQHPNITVRDQANVREYLKWWNSLIWFTHWHTAKAKDLPWLMLRDAKQDGIKYRYFDKWHSHQIAIENMQGMEIVTNPAGGWMNAWSDWLGVDKSNYKIACDVYNKTNGKIFTKYQPVR